MTQDSPQVTERCSYGLRRRDFLWSVLGTTALMATASWVRAPAVISGEKPHATMQSWNNFVPETDAELRRQAEEYTKHAGVEVTVDFVAHLRVLRLERRRTLKCHEAGYREARYMLLMCQISLAYSRTVRSLENFPTRAILRIAFRAQVAGSLNSRPACSCLSRYEARSAK